MFDDEPPPVISRTALALLDVARENDKHRAMARNALLMAALEVGAELIEVCRTGNPHALSSLLKAESPPKNFLVITAMALNRIRDRADEHLHGDSDAPKAPAVGDYNRPALQGFAVALADLSWPERAARDFDGPGLDEFVSRIAQHDLETFWLATFQHYLANILQEYFVDLPAKTQEKARALDPNIEVNLRLVDGRVLAEYAMKLAASMGKQNSDPAMIAFSLDQAIDKILRR